MKKLSLKEGWLLGETRDLWTQIHACFHYVLSPLWFSCLETFLALSLSLVDLSFRRCFSFVAFVADCWESQVFVSVCSCLPFCRHESRNDVFQFGTLFRRQEKELAFTECLLYTKHFSLLRLCVAHNYFVKVVLFSFNKWGHWNLEKLDPFLMDTEQLGMILKPIFLPYALMRTHSIHFCWNKTNTTVV